MFLLDDVLLAPGKAAYVIFQELARKAQEEWLNDDVVKQELQQLYEMLESGRISDKDFDAKECGLLERLEQIAKIKFQDRWGSEPAANASVQDPASLPTGPTLIDDTPRQASIAVVQPPEPAVQVLPRVAPSQPVTAPAFVAPAMPAAVPTCPAVLPEPPAVYARATEAPTRAPAGALSINEVIESAVRALAILKFRVSSITSVTPAEDGWRVTVELVERRGLPDTNDLLGIYELRLDPTGTVLRYERTQVRRRCDLNR